MRTAITRMTTTVCTMALLLVGAIPASAQGGFRLAGGVDSGQPVEASLAVSQEVIQDGAAGAVVLGRSDNFADNLGGAVLARTVNGPLLLNPRDQLDSRIAAEIARVLPPQQADCQALASQGEAEVYILGGTGAIAQDIENQLAGNFCVLRLSGPSRVETSVEVAGQVERVLQNRGGFNGYRYLIARADNAVDSATGGAYGGIFGIPILVTASDSLHPAVESYLAGGAAEVAILGGQAAVSADVERRIDEVLAPQGTVSYRLSGASRDDTARVIAEDFASRRGGINDVTLVNGFIDDAWVFALTSAAVNPGEPVLYVQRDDLLQTTRSFIQSRAPLTGVNVFGSTNVVSDAVLADARAAAS